MREMITILHLAHGATPERVDTEIVGLHPARGDAVRFEGRYYRITEVLFDYDRGVINCNCRPFTPPTT